MAKPPAQIKAEVNAAFRDFEVDGVPASGEHDPVKSKIRNALGDAVDLAGEARDIASTAGTTLVMQTRAQLNALPGPFDVGARAEVRADPAGNVTNGNGVYRWSGTAWVWIDNIVPASVQNSITNAAIAGAEAAVAPFTNEVDRLKNTVYEAVPDTSPGILAAVGDPSGRFVPFMRDDGRLVQLLADGSLAVVPYGESGVVRAPLWRLIEGERPSLLIVDPSDRIVQVETIEGSVFGLDAAGNLVRFKSPGGNGPGMVEPEYLGQPFEWGRYQTLHAPAADVCLILLTMGQSNATGVNGTSDVLPGATPIYPDDALMLAGSSPRRTGTGLTLDTATLKEAAMGGERETAATSIASHLIRDIEAATGRRIRVLSAVTALGGRPYRGLSRGSAPYETMLATVRSMAAICRARGWIPVCPGVDWMQGESDAGGSVMSDGRTSSLPAADYVRGMRQFSRQLSGDIRAITGQAEDVPLFISHLARSAPTSAFGIWYLSAREAQRELHGEGLIRLVGAGYPFDFTPDGLHLASSGQNGRGQQVARAMTAEVFGQGWSPVIDRSHRWVSATQLEVEFEVPTLPLVIDNSGDVVATTELTVSKGFHFDDGTASPPSITSVAVQGDRAVRITLSAAPGGVGSCRVGYALKRVDGSIIDGRLTGARGLLRDSSSSPNAFGLGDQSNWCVSFIREVGRP